MHTTSEEMIELLEKKVENEKQRIYEEKKEELIKEFGDIVYFTLTSLDYVKFKVKGEKAEWKRKLYED